MTRLFLELTPDRVLDAVETTGARATGFCLTLNSLENRVYEVEIETDVRWVVKFYRPGRWSKGAILEEHQYLAELRAAEIPVVAPFDLGGGETLREIEGIFFAVFPKMRGRAPDELDDGQLVQLGRLLARMHTVGAARPARARLRLDPDSTGASSLDALLATQWIPIELRQKYRTAVQKVLDAARPLWRDLPMHRIHGDCHLGNLLWNADGPFFVDFDDMVTGPAVQDVWMLSRGRDAEADRQRMRILDGYSEMRELDRTQLRLVEPLRALRIVHYSAWIASHWQDPAFPRVFSDFPSFEYWAREVEQLEHVVGALFDPRTAPN